VAQRLRGLGDVDDALDELESGAERAARPRQNGIPKLVLTRNQPWRTLGAVEQQIGRKVLLDFGRDRLRRSDRCLREALPAQRPADPAAQCP